MFDRITLGHTGKEYVPYAKTINIGRAPTDESVKLYGEFQEKAYKSILDSMQISGNVFNFNAIITKSADTFEKCLRYRFRLNSTEYEGKIAIDVLAESMDKVAAVEDIYRDLANEIAKKIITEAIAK